MSKITTGRVSIPEVEVDSEFIAFQSQFVERSPLNQIAREGAQRMLQQAIEAEVGQFPPCAKLDRAVDRASKAAEFGFELKANGGLSMSGDGELG